MAVKVGELYVEMGIDTSGVSKGLSAAQSRIQGFGDTMTKFGKTMSLAVTAPLVALGTASVKSASDYESAFAGVRKTINMTEAQFSVLSDQILEMTRRIPVAATEIAGVAEAAGQLGIKNENLIGFTETMLNLGVATNMSSEQAATALARLANITQMPQENFERLGSSIVALGNSLATTESEITEMSVRLAAAATQAGFSEAQIMGLSGALSSVGVNAQAGGGSMTRVINQISAAVAKGGTDLQGFASVAGMSAQEFQKAWGEDAGRAFATFIEGLGRAQKEGKVTSLVLEELGIKETMAVTALSSLATAGDLVSRSMNIANQAWEENTALANEAAERYKTFESQVQFLKNALSEVGIAIGNVILPALNSAIQAIRPVITGFADWAKEHPGIVKIGVAIAAVTAAIGPVALAIGKVIEVLPILKVGFAAISGPVGIVIAAIGGLIALFVKLYNENKEFAAGVTAIWNKLKDMFSNALNGIGSAISGFAQNLFGKGSNIGAAFGQGFMQGLSAVAQSIFNVVAKIANGVVNMIKSVLQIHSPSRVADALGVNFGETFGRGIQKGGKKAIDEAKALAEAVTKALEEGQKQYEKFGNGLVTALKNRYAEQYDTITSNLKKLNDISAENYKKQQKTAEQSLKNQLKTIEDGLKQQLKAVESSTKAEQKAIKAASEANIKQYRKEYGEKLKLVDDESASAIAALEAQIDALDAETEAEDERTRQKEYNQKLTDLNAKLAIATAEDRADIEKEIAEMIADEERRQLLIRRKQEQESLKQQIQAVKDAASQKKEVLEAERDDLIASEEAKTDAALEQLDIRAEAEKERVNTQLDIEKETYNTRIEASKEHYDELIETEKNKLDEMLAQEKNIYDQQINESSLLAETRKMLLEGNQEEMLSLLQEYNPYWQDAGQDLSDALMNGLNSQNEPMQEAIKTALDLGPAIEADKLLLDELNAKIAALGEAESAAGSGGGGGGAGKLDALGSQLEGLNTDFDEFAISAEEATASVEENVAAMNATTAASTEGIGLSLGGIGEKFNTLKETFSSAKDAIIPIFSDLWAMVTGDGWDIPGKLEIVKGIFSDVWSGIQTVLSDVWDGINDHAQTVFGELETFWENHGKGIQETLTNAWDATWSAIDSVWTIIKDAAAAFWDALFDFWDKHGKKVIEIFRKTWELIWSILKPIWDEISKSAKTVFDTLKKFWDTWGKDILKQFEIVWNTISDVFGGVLDAISGSLDIFIGLFTGNWKRAWEGVKSVFSGIWDAMKGIVKGAVNSIINIVNAMIKGLNMLKIPEGIPGIGGKGVNIPLIPTLHTGGVFETLNKAGEGLALLKSGEMVLTKAQQKQLFDIANSKVDLLSTASQQNSSHAEREQAAEPLAINLILNNATFADKNMLQDLVDMVKKQIGSELAAEVKFKNRLAT